MPAQAGRHGAGVGTVRGAGVVGSKECQVILQTGDLAEWMRFAAVEFRPRLALSLLDHFGSPGAVMGASRGELARHEGCTSDVLARFDAACRLLVSEEQAEFSRQRSVQAVTFGSPEYPPLLATIADAPPVLFVRGDPAVLARDAVALVGTRSPSHYGRGMADKIASGLAGAGMVVVSGGAVGIDAAAHQGALRCGATVAVLGCGLDVRYPASNQQLFDSICQNGAVVTEFALGTRPDTWRFPARNRIISGICRATVVVEAPSRSGALITAGFAAEQGRDVMAVPGPADSRDSRGCHALIRDGAELVENAEQVLTSIGWMTSGMASAAGSPVTATLLPPDLPLVEGQILMAIGGAQRHMDELGAECKLSPSEVGAAITLLELRGLVRRTPGNFFVRC